MNFLSNVSGLVAVILGVVTAVILPLLCDAVRKYFPPVGGFWDNYRWAVRYIVLAAFSIVVAGIIYAQWRNGHPSGVLNGTDGFLLGFSGESAIEKMFRPKVQG
jgi:Na+/H+ antiporter NhaA